MQDDAVGEGIVGAGLHVFPGEVRIFLQHVLHGVAGAEKLEHGLHRDARGRTTGRSLQRSGEMTMRSGMAGTYHVRLGNQLATPQPKRAADEVAAAWASLEPRKLGDAGWGCRNQERDGKRLGGHGGHGGPIRGHGDLPRDDRSARLRDMSRNSAEMAGQPGEEPALVPARQLVLPDTDHFPALGAEGAGDEAVAGLVGRNLLPPERGVGLGLGGVLGTTVPEAAIDENGEFQFGENKVGFAGELRSAWRGGDAVCAKRALSCSIQ